MSAFQIFTQPSQQALDTAANVLSGATLTFTLTGTSTPTNAYSDSSLTTPAANPLSANAAGVFIPIFLDPAVTYRIVLKSQTGTVLQTWDPANEQILSQSIIAGFLFPRTAIEISVGTTPTALNRDSERGYDVRRVGITGSGDETTKLQAALNACNGKLYIPNLTITTSAQIDVPAETEIVCDPGATIAAGSSFSTTGWNLLNLKGSATIRGLTLAAPDVARNTFWKAIAADNSVQTLAANTRIIVQNCSVTGFDIGTYTDGGAAQNVDYMEASACRIVINTSGTGGGSSIRPTVSCNNVRLVAIKDNPVLDASDATNAVNNIYCIGCAKVSVVGNRILNGVGVKILSNSTNAVKHAVVDGNYLSNIQYIYFQADGNPIEVIDLTDNTFDAPNTNIATPEVVLFETTALAVTGDAFVAVNSKGNSFKNVPHSIYFPNMTAGKTFGSMTCEGNTYTNTSTSSAGTYGVISNGGAGTYRALNASNETVIGNSNTRSYLQGTPTFASTNFGDIIESGCTNARSGVNQGSYTGTLVNGVSGAVTGTIQWTERDGLVTLYIPTINDTSTTVAQKQITGTVPTIIKPTTQQRCIGLCLDNSTGKISIIQIETTGTITLYNALASAFTAAGTCGTSACTVTFRTTT